MAQIVSVSCRMQCHINDSRISTATMRTLALVIISAFVFARAVQPLPSSQEEFFDLLPVQFPFPLPSWSLDEVASRLSPACNSLQDLLALAIASSQLHSFNVRSDGSYDLSLPPFDAKLPPTDVQLLLGTCERISALYAGIVSKLLFSQLLCPAGSCTSTMDEYSGQLTFGSLCQGISGESFGQDPVETGLAIFQVHVRAVARMGLLATSFCEALRERNNRNMQHLQDLAGHAAEEVRNFLDHAFQSLSVTHGLPAIPPLSEFLSSPQGPVFLHVPVAGQRWHVLQHILSSFPSVDRHRGLRVAEVGVEKGMTITYLMKHDEAIAEYVAVDPWHIPGKSDESNAILEGYHENLKAWSQEQPAFQRHGHGAVRVLRKASEDAAGFVEADYFDLVFIDADHTFEAARRDIQVWRRRVRPNGGILAGHDFSLFHPAVALAVVVECSSSSSDAERFPLESENGRPIIRLSSDSVWWVVRS